jgi:hypothetical protein
LKVFDFDFDFDFDFFLIWFCLVWFCLFVWDTQREIQ